MAISENLVSRTLRGLLVFLAASAVYLYGFPQTNVFYAVVVMLHAVTGVLAGALLGLRLGRLLRNGSLVTRTAWALVSAGAVVGIALIKLGTSRPEWHWLYLHVLLSM